MTAGGVHDLLRDASELVPGVLELEVEELIAGLRPGTPDNTPVIGRSAAAPELVWATGHYRNGVLLAPVTGDLVADVAGRRRRRPRLLARPLRRGGRVTICVNGEPRERSGATIAELLADLGVEAAAARRRRRRRRRGRAARRVGRAHHHRGPARRGAVRHAGRLTAAVATETEQQIPVTDTPSRSPGARCARA